VLQPRLGALVPARAPSTQGGAGRDVLRRAYLGYFGAAGGVLLLAALAATISESLIRISRIK